jgi:hypothetical protein
VRWAGFTARGGPDVSDRQIRAPGDVTSARRAGRWTQPRSRDRSKRCRFDSDGGDRNYHGDRSPPTPAAVVEEVPAGWATLAIATQRCNGQWDHSSPTVPGASSAMLTRRFACRWLHAPQRGANRTGVGDATRSANPPGDQRDLWHQVRRRANRPMRPIILIMANVIGPVQHRPGALPRCRFQPARFVAPSTREFSLSPRGRTPDRRSTPAPAHSCDRPHPCGQ